MSLSSSSAIRFLQRNTISSSCGGTVRDKKRASSVMLWYREEEAEAGTNGKKKPTTAKQRSIDVDQYRDKKRRDFPRSRLGVTPLAILSARQVFAIPRFSSHRADDGCRRLATPNTCTCREYPGYNEESLRWRTLPIVARQEATKTNFAGCDAAVMSSGLRYVQQIYKKKGNDSCCRIKEKFKVNFYKRNNVRGVCNQ